MAIWRWTGVVELGELGQTITTGQGSPEGVVTALKGSIYLRMDGSIGTCLYVKEEGSGSAGWHGLGSIAVPAITEDMFSFLDTTTANTNTTQHGLMPKLPGDNTTFFRGDGTFAIPSVGSSALANDTDVQLSTLNNGDLLIYNTSSGKWINSPIAFTNVAYATSTVVPMTTDYIRGIGGDDGITLTLTPRNNPYFTRKTDSGVGSINFISLNGEFIADQTNYILTQQGQWAIFIWNSTNWDVFGGQSA